MNDDLLAWAKLRCEELLTFFAVNTDVKLTEEGDTIHIAADVADSGRLIGHRGETLQALQHLLNMMVKNRTAERVFVSLDIAGYKKGRSEALGAQAVAEAEKVKQTGVAHSLRPMSPAERRIVHMALADVEGITTESEGEGRERRVVIKKSLISK
jgi:spoIIIJ-associated protein